jgi:hypothetical protein
VPEGDVCIDKAHTDCSNLLIGINAAKPLIAAARSGQDYEPTPI